MSTDPFSNAADAFEKGQSSSPEEKGEVSSSQDQNLAPQNQTTNNDPTSKVSQAIAELDKMDKFKLDGQEWTLKDLKAAIMRQKDYTAKTQSLSEERKSFDGERKYYENLTYDLRALEKNPALVSEFIKVYPEKFHQYADQILKNNQNQAVPQVQQGQAPDVQLLSRLNRLEQFYHDQEVAKNEQAIKSTMDDLTKKYPDTDNKLARETILARAHELYLGQGQPLSQDTWGTIFKDVAEEIKSFAKAQYGENVKKQVEANAKSRDVGAGGGTAGRAPVKFNKFDDITKAALNSIGS